MQEEHPESFDLPDWGTEGAPPPPPTEGDEEPGDESLDVILSVTPELIRLAGPIPNGFRIVAVLGIVAAEGSATVNDDTTLAAAMATARSSALDRLSSQASTMGATVLADLTLVTVNRLNDVVVTAYGTAYDATQAL